MSTPYLTDVALGNKNVPGCQVSVHKPLAGQVVHPEGHLLGELEQQLRHVG